MLRECDRAVTCFPCADEASNPFANLSAEDPDLNIFLNVHFGVVTNVIPNVWRRDTCVGFCESSISQVDADDCARRRALECIPEPPLPPIPPQPPIPLPPQQAVFCNQEMTCQSGSECYTIPACTVFSHSQADANAIAASICEVRANDPATSSPCSGGGGGGGGSGGDPGQLVTYEKAWNTGATESDPPRGAWFEGDPCPWPDDYASVWPSPGNECLCSVDNADPFQWPFGEGSPKDSDSIVTQMDNVLDAVLDSFVLPDTGDYQNRSSTERLYLRTRIEGGESGKHVKMSGSWSKPGGAWVEQQWNPDTSSFDALPSSSEMKLGFNYDPCALFESSGAGLQVLEIGASPASGDLVYEFDVPADAVFYACVWFESRTHNNGPSMLHLVTTIT